MKVCNKCNLEYAQIFNFCNNCGSPAFEPEPNFCSNSKCSELKAIKSLVISNNSKYCGKCGSLTTYGKSIQSLK